MDKHLDISYIVLTLLKYSLYKIGHRKFGKIEHENGLQIGSSVISNILM